MLRCEKSVQCLGCVAKRQIPVMNTAGHALEKLPKYKLFIQVPKQVNHHVVSITDLGQIVYAPYASRVAKTSQSLD